MDLPDHAEEEGKGKGRQAGNGTLLLLIFIVILKKGGNWERRQSFLLNAQTPLLN